MTMAPPALRLLRTLLALMVLPPAVPVPVPVPGPCPRPCSCPKPSELHCTFRSLVSFPAAVSRHVERINLGFNSISRISDGSLSGLRKLELLMVHGNDIHRLPDGAFRDLSSLQMLKLSYNKLTEVSRHTLRGLWALARLHLDHNRLEFLHPDAFQGLTSLRLLQLEGNRLQQLHPATFATFTLLGHLHVSTLRHLYLSDNGLTALPAGLVASMPQLENLYLHGNPWTCDCHMQWLHRWDKASPGVLKCKKDRALPGGQLCPVCSSPRHLQSKELQAMDALACSGPVISSARRTSPPDRADGELLTAEAFREPFGNVSLGLSDEHGNAVELKCGVGEPRELGKPGWEPLGPLRLAANVSLAVDLECAVDRDKYERLWRLIAYYSSVPAHLQRGVLLSQEPQPTYVYRQDPERDALYYTGVKAHVTARPAWLMQPSADLQLNRLRSSARTVKLILSLRFSETVEAEPERRRARSWVMIESTNATRTALTAVLGGPARMDCRARGSGRPALRWVLPDGSALEAARSRPDRRLSVSAEGQLLIDPVEHSDAGLYYCVAAVHADLDVLPVHLTVQESSSPAPGEDAAGAPVEAFAGSPVSLPCASSGSPDADVHWLLPSGAVVTSRANSSRAFVHANGSLLLPQAHLTDSGHYKCIAVNQHGVDTMSTALSVTRRAGLIRPLRKFPARPQSASGVSTQIKVPVEDPEDASGDAEGPQAGDRLIPRPDPSRRRIQGGAASGRRGLHPARSTRWRPGLRKPAGARPDDGTPALDGRRKINVSKSKIDPEKWADILAKIRDRKTQNPASTPPLTTPLTTPLDTLLTTASQENLEGSSEEDELFTTPHTRPTAQQHTHVTSHSSSAQDELHTHTSAPHATHTANTVQHTTPGPSPAPRSPSAAGFLPPQTTSVPPHAVTGRQRHASRASGGRTPPRPESPSASADVDAAAARPAARGGNGRRAKGRSKNGRKTQKAVARPSEEEKPPPQPEDPTPEPHTQAMLTTASPNTTPPSTTPPNTTPPNTTPPPTTPPFTTLPSTTPPPTTPPSTTPPNTTPPNTTPPPTMPPTTPPPNTTPPPATSQPAESDGSDGRSPSRRRRPNSKRRNGDRRKRPSRRKHKQEPPPTASTPAQAAVATGIPAVSTLPEKIDPLGVTPAKFDPAAPFSGGQAAVSHDQTSESLHGAEAAAELATTPAWTPETETTIMVLSSAPETETSSPPPASTPEPPLHSTLAAFPSASPGSPDGNTSSEAAQEAATPPTASAPPPTAPSDGGGVTGDLRPSSRSHGSSGEFHTVTAAHTDVGLDRSGPGYDLAAGGGRSEAGESDERLSPLPPPSVSDPTAVTQTSSGDAAGGFSPTPSWFPEADQSPAAPQTSNQSPAAPQTSNQSPAAPQTSNQSPAAPQTSIQSPADAEITTRPSSTAAKPDVYGTTAAPRVTPPKPSSTGAEMGPSPGAATQEAPRDPEDHDQDRQIQPVGPAEPGTTPDGSAAPFVSITPTPPGPAATRDQPITGPAATTPAIQTHPLTPTGTRAPGPARPPGRPRITQSERLTLSVKAEADATLPCEAAGQPPPLLSWTQLATGASVSQRRRLPRFEVQPNGSLVIRRTQPQDGGRYLCRVQNQHGSAEALLNLVVVSVPPRVLRPRHSDITVRLGDAVHLDCQAEGHPAPRVSWVLPSLAQVPAPPPGVLAPQQRLVVWSNGTLRISRAAYADRGLYKCIGSSAAGADTVSVRLLVSATPPVIHQPPHENATLPEGAAAYLHCTAAGTPQPAIRWVTPDGVQLAASQFVSGRNFFVFPNGTLFVRGASSADAGTYECSASNAVASSRRTVTLSVRRSPSAAKASITAASPQRTDVVYGGTLLLDCVATGQPGPRVIWRTPSKKLVDAQYSFDPRIKVFPNGSLSVRAVTDEDAGDYLCVARNKMGDDYVLLQVGVLTRPAKIRQKPQQSSQEVVYGGDLKVDCVASGLPDPEISWALPDGTMVNPAKQRDGVGGGRSRRYVVFDNGTLYFNHVGMPEEGDYTCYAENQLGKDEMRVRVKVKEAPSAPRVHHAGPNTVRVFYGETAALRCGAAAEAEPAVTWVSPTNRVVLPAPDKYRILDDGTLVVQKVQRADGGNYTCMAPTEHRVTRLEVLVTAPLINGLSGAANAVEATAVQDRPSVLDCVAKGTPAPRVMWVLPGNVILPAPYHSKRMTVHQNGSLEIRSPKRTDSGQLVCIARNEGGEVRLLVNLDVAAQRPGPDSAVSPGRKPQIANRYGAPVSVMNGDGVWLHCLSGGDPLRLTWTLPSGVVLHRPQRAGRYAVLPNGTLAIQQASVYDRGSYVCRAANEYGSALLPVTVAVVAYPPRITNGPPSVTYAKRGVAVQLNCVASGMPRADVAWETPDKTRLSVGAQPRLFGNKYLHPQGSLIIQNPTARDAGVYRCTARNAVGADAKATLLNVF